MTRKRTVFQVAILWELVTLSTACVPDSEAARVRTWRITNECPFEVGVHIGDPLRDGNDEMKRANTFISSSTSEDIHGEVASNSELQLWAWSRDRVDRSIIKIDVDRNGQEVVLDGKRCEFMGIG